MVSETLAGQISGWTGIPSVALRLSNIMEPEDYQRFPLFWGDARLRRWNLWGYIDVRDVAAAFRHALAAPVQGSVSAIIAAADTVMDRPSLDLLREVFPEVPVIRELAEFETLLAIRRAGELLGFTPAHSWRDHLEG